MLKSIKFSNYRIFNSEQVLDLAPITVIFGKNNTGKSALLKLPLLIKSGFNNDPKELFPRAYKGVQICNDYRDIVYGKALKAATITISDEKNDTLTFRFYVEPTENASFRPILEDWLLTSHDGQELHISRQENGTLSDNKAREYEFSGFIPYLHDDLSWAKGTLASLSFETDYLKSIREAPAMDFRLHDKHEFGVGVSGTFAYDYLVEDLVSGNGELLNKVSSWYEQNFDKWKLSIDQSHAPVYYFEMQNDPIKVNILETGTGIIQSLPVIVSSCLSCGLPLLSSYEEPETHTHPSAHASMAEFMALEAKSNPLKKMLIETHSLNFILRLRTLIAEKKLSPSDVALYFIEFKEEKKGSTLTKISIDELGKVSYWPEGMLNEGLSEAIKLRQAQINNEK